MGSDDFDQPIDHSLVDVGHVTEEERQVGWYVDPFGRHEQRWWDGRSWSERIRTNAGGQGIDPPGIDVAPIAVTESIPANPIEDALLPIRRGPIADKIALLVGCVVFLGLVAVLVVALAT